MKKLFLILLVVLISLLYVITLKPNSKPDTAFVYRVVDGDTFDLRDGSRVRLLGINTPEESQYLYTDARNKLKDLIENKTVTLEKNTFDRDVYGRLLRYVFINDTYVNLELVKNGYAHLFNLSATSKLYEQMIEAEEKARDENIGIWKQSEFFGCINITYFHYNPTGYDYKNLNDEYIVFKNICPFSINMSKWGVKDEETHSYVFPNFSLKEGSSAKLRSGFGTDDSNDLFWRSKYPIWDNYGDSLFLRDEKGFLVLFYRY